MDRNLSLAKFLPRVAIIPPGSWRYDMARTQRARCITTRGHQSFFFQRERIQVRSHLALPRRRFRDVPQSAGDSEGNFAEANERPRLDPFISSPAHKSERPLIKVHFNVAYRCHSRQLLCMGGSQFPFGWSFVSIAKLPMTWNPRDRWTAEARHAILIRNASMGLPGLLADGYEVRVQVRHLRRTGEDRRDSKLWNYYLGVDQSARRGQRGSSRGHLQERQGCKSAARRSENSKADGHR